VFKKTQDLLKRELSKLDVCCNFLEGSVLRAASLARGGPRWEANQGGLNNYFTDICENFFVV